MKRYQHPTPWTAQWTDNTQLADPLAKVPKTREVTLYKFLGATDSDYILDRIEKAIKDNLAYYYANGILLTPSIISGVIDATEDESSAAFGCLSCIPDPLGDPRWYNSCTKTWGTTSL